MSRGYRLPVKVVKQQRPFGVGVFAGLGMIGGLILGVAAVIGIWSLMRISVAPSRELAVLGLMLVVALVVLRINWGFWEMIKWTWWANLLLTLLSIAAMAFALRYVPMAAEFINRLHPEFAVPAVSTVLRGALIGGMVLDLVVLVYLFSVRAVYGVGVKDERPLWEKIPKY